MEPKDADNRVRPEVALSSISLLIAIIGVPTIFILIGLVAAGRIPAVVAFLIIAGMALSSGLLMLVALIIRK